MVFDSADVSHVDHFESYRCSVDGIWLDMCGRYSLGLSNEEVYDGLEARLPQLFEQGRPRWEREQDHRPRYASTLTCSGQADNRHNVAPRQRAPVIHRDSESDNGGAMIEEM